MQLNVIKCGKDWNHELITAGHRFDQLWNFNHGILEFWRLKMYCKIAINNCWAKMLQLLTTLGPCALCCWSFVSFWECICVCVSALAANRGVNHCTLRFAVNFLFRLCLTGFCYILWVFIMLLYSWMEFHIIFKNIFLFLNIV